jgi:hypothetical protein
MFLDVLGQVLFDLSVPRNRLPFSVLGIEIKIVARTMPMENTTGFR